jgi:hypothetical protein
LQDFSDLQVLVSLDRHNHSQSMMRVAEKRIAHAPQPEMWSADKERTLVPIASHAERPMPDARRPVPRRAEGEQKCF